MLSTFTGVDLFLSDTEHDSGYFCLTSYFNATSMKLNVNQLCESQSTYAKRTREDVRSAQMRTFKARPDAHARKSIRKHHFISST